MWTKVNDPWEGELRTDARVRAKLLWDEQHLYFLAEIYDTSRNYNFDNFELYYLGTEMPSAIEHIRSENTYDESERIYDLAGRRLNGKPNSKGIYIINGKKHFVK
jgi:hypothetical protein